MTLKLLRGLPPKPPFYFGVLQYSTSSLGEIGRQSKDLHTLGDFWILWKKAHSRLDPCISELCFRKKSLESPDSVPSAVPMLLLLLSRFSRV